MRFASLPLAVAFVLLTSTSAAADVVLDGRGFGHGIGLSQYGAYGFALREGRDHDWILRHYFTGTTLGQAPKARMRVLLKQARAPKVCGATRARDAGGRRIRLRGGRGYRFHALGADRLRVIDARRGRTRARLRAPVRVTGGRSTCLRGVAENGVRNGEYRGRMVLERDGSRVLAVNDLGLERYTAGVVPAEVPASWPAEALAAQAVIARSYALRSRRPDAAYDVYADVRSQVYRGLTGEVDTTNAATRETRGEVVLADGEVAHTFFFSTSGGRTAANEEIWSGAPIAYLRSVDDPHDDLSPYHEWTVRLSDDEAARRLSGLVPGSFRRLRVVSRTASGRAETVAIVGTGGSNRVPAATIRLRLELRSTWFRVS